MPETEALATLARVAESRGLSILLIGALAREIIFDQQFEGRSYRATRDIDVGVRVSTWEDYRTFVAALESAGFTHDAEHKLRYKDGTELDLLPFGGVVDENNKLAWMGGDRVMSMDGFESADAHGELHRVAGVQLRVINLPGLIMLKLFAFREHGVSLLRVSRWLGHSTTRTTEKVYIHLLREASHGDALSLEKMLEL